MRWRVGRQDEKNKEIEFSLAEALVRHRLSAQVFTGPRVSGSRPGGLKRFTVRCAGVTRLANSPRPTFDSVGLDIYFVSTVVPTLL